MTTPQFQPLFQTSPTVHGTPLAQIRWVHKVEVAIPYAKGKGVSLMVTDFVSADYGWLHSPDGSQQAQVLFKAGKVWEGYFTNDDILWKATNMMDILPEHYPSEKKHFFCF